jgi:hypothetical protein
MNTQRICRFALFGLVALAALAWSRSATQAQPGGMPFPPMQGVLDQTDLAPSPTVHLLTPMRSAQECRTWLKLHTTSLSFPKETTLEDAIKAIRSSTRGRGKDDPAIPIYIDPLGLQAAEKTMKSTVQFDVEDIPLASSLNLILSQLGLIFRVKADGLLIITNEGDETVPDDPSALILDNLSKLRSDVTALRLEIFALREGNSTAQKPEPAGGKDTVRGKSSGVGIRSVTPERRKSNN